MLLKKIGSKEVKNVANYFNGIKEIQTIVVKNKEILVFWLDAQAGMAHSLKGYEIEQIKKIVGTEDVLFLKK